jgi:outer membrane protein assembly factor BamD (BamD/ComL family)
MHVLTDRGEPVAVAERFQRLCMEMADRPAEEQAEMRIKAVPVLD